MKIERVERRMRVTATVDRDVLKKLDRTAQEKGLSRSGLLNRILVAIFQLDEEVMQKVGPSRL